MQVGCNLKSLPQNDLIERKVEVFSPGLYLDARANPTAAQ